MEYFDATGVVEAYQYSAILDDVTSEICGNLHGLTFPKGESPVPPMHFNCRSVLVPITRFESWSADKTTNSGQNLDKFLEKNVTDKGFAVYSKETKKPKIGDPGVSFETRNPSAIVEIITYSKDGMPFQETIIQYENEHKLKINSCDHRRLDA